MRGDFGLHGLLVSLIVHQATFFSRFQFAAWKGDAGCDRPCDTTIGTRFVDYDFYARRGA
jgi:hypothetical protein